MPICHQIQLLCLSPLDIGFYTADLDRYRYENRVTQFTCEITRLPALKKKKTTLPMFVMRWFLNAASYCLQERKPVGRKNPPAHPLGMIIKVKPQPKKAKLDPGTSDEPSDVAKTRGADAERASEPVTTRSNNNVDKTQDVRITGLVSYSDESEEDDD